MVNRISSSDIVPHKAKGARDAGIREGLIVLDKAAQQGVVVLAAQHRSKVAMVENDKGDVYMLPFAGIALPPAGGVFDRSAWKISAHDHFVIRNDIHRIRNEFQYELAAVLGVDRLASTGTILSMVSKLVQESDAPVGTIIHEN
jgi:hypothetical protein